MKFINLFTFVFFQIFIINATAEPNSSQQTFSHQLNVTLNPETHEINGTDEIILPSKNTDYYFILDQSITVTMSPLSKGQLLKESTSYGPTLQTWKLSIAQDQKVTLLFQGEINHPVIDEDSPGHIGLEGVTLFPSTGWYPYFVDQLEVFSIQIKMKNQWPALTQGVLISENSTSIKFLETSPQKGIYLFSGPFFKTTKVSNGIVLNTYLRNEKPELANQLLESLSSSLDHYLSILGPYPYKQFSVIENFWETGYGMPSITLLGSQVVQLPFLITSSLPHELLHNWWGNSVYVNNEFGNWCEGLTTYGADHWQQELKNNDANYRRDSLIQYKNFVSQTSEFPLVEFKARHNSSSQAIGYGKSMMFYHMLKIFLGPVQFEKSLAQFYQDFKFQEANWFDMQKSFERSSGKTLNTFFQQWLTKTGAPEISIEKYLLKKNSVHIDLSQKNKENNIYDLHIPLKITYKSFSEKILIHLNQSSQSFEIDLKEAPISIAVDPEFDNFRQIYNDEVPVLFSAFFGEKHFAYFSTDEKSNSVVNIFNQKFNSTSESVTDIDTQSPQLLIGFDSKIKDLLNLALADQKIQWTDSEVLIDGEKLLRSENTFAMSFRYNNKIFFWISGALGEDIARSAQRFTHYTNQSLVVFKKDKGLIKKTWEPKKSPLFIQF